MTLYINAALAHRLVKSQFPEWKKLPVRPVMPGGWDNRIFRLGEQMLIRLPSGAEYAFQVEKEQRWLPKLALLLPLPIPEPLAIGEPEFDYPWKWSIYRWLEGEPASSSPIIDMCHFAKSLAQFLSALQRIDTVDGPPPGLHSFYRGGLLSTYDAETRQAIAVLKGKIHTDAATRIWEEALATALPGPSVWVHGDISPGNLLVQKGELCAIIDFGQMAVGDPACDLAIAWTLFKDKSREIFHSSLSFDAGTWARGRAWALWKALIVAARLAKTNAAEEVQCWRTLDEVLGGKATS